jgi:hypothetical protein
MFVNPIITRNDAVYAPLKKDVVYLLWLRSLPHQERKPISVWFDLHARHVSPGVHAPEAWKSHLNSWKHSKAHVYEGAHTAGITGMSRTHEDHPDIGTLPRACRRLGNRLGATPELDHAK